MIGTDAQLLECFTRTHDETAFESAGDPPRADGPGRLPPGTAGSARGRGCLPGHVPGAGPQRRQHPPAGSTGQLAVRRGLPGGRQAAACRPAQPGQALGPAAGRGPTPGRSGDAGGLAGITAVARPGAERAAGEVPRPLVLCGLEGKSQAEAARARGVRASSLSSRLARGRELLRGRLAKRGVALSAGLLFPLLGERSRPPCRTPWSAPRSRRPSS